MTRNFMTTLKHWKTLHVITCEECSEPGYNPFLSSPFTPKLACKGLCIEIYLQ